MTSSVLSYYSNIQTPGPHLHRLTGLISAHQCSPSETCASAMLASHTQFVPTRGLCTVLVCSWNLSHWTSVRLDPFPLRSHFKWPPLQEAIRVHSTSLHFSHHCFFLSSLPSVINFLSSLCAYFLPLPLERDSIRAGTLFVLFTDVSLASRLVPGILCTQ